MKHFLQNTKINMRLTDSEQTQEYIHRIYFHFSTERAPIVLHFVMFNSNKTVGGWYLSHPPECCCSVPIGTEAHFVPYRQVMCWTKKQGSEIISAQSIYNKLHRHLLSALLRDGWHVQLSQLWAVVSILIFLWSLTRTKSILLPTFFAHSHPLSFRAADETEMLCSFLFDVILYDRCEK